MTLTDRYQETLRNIPTPGGCCHTAIRGFANQGIMAGLSAEEIFSDIWHATGKIDLGG